MDGYNHLHKISHDAKDSYACTIYIIYHIVQTSQGVAINTH